MIGVIAAMDIEKEAVVKRMQDVENIQIGPVAFAKGRLVEHEAVVALSGVGKTAAAMAATAMIMEFHPDVMINVGVAGGLKFEQHPGDLVISDSLVQADFDTSEIDGEQGIGLMYQADPIMVELAEKAAGNLNIPWTTGMIATQDLFMSRKEDYDKLMKHFPQSACSEMEGAAIASVAKAFKVPFVALRSLSDVAVNDENPMQFEEFKVMGSQRAADLLVEMGKEMLKMPRPDGNQNCQ